MALTQIDDRGLKTPIDLLDNEKIRLGTGNDLELYHDGSNNYIKDSGTGNLLIDQSTANVLYLRSDDLRLSSYTGTETYIDCNLNGAVELYYDNSKKLESTNTGAIVSGSLICQDASEYQVVLKDTDHNGNSAETAIGFKGNDDSTLGLIGMNYWGDGNLDIQNNLSGAGIAFETNDGSSTAERMRIDSSGNLLLGTTSGSGKLHVEHSGENNVYFVGNTSTSGARLILQNKNTTANSFTGVLGADAGGQTTASIKFYSADNDNNEGYLTLETRPSGGLPTERMRIDSSGRVAIGTDTSNTSSNAPLTIKSTGSSATRFNLVNSGSSSVESTQIFSQNNELAFTASGSEKLRILNGGGITFNGDTAAANALDDYEEGSYTPVIYYDSTNDHTYTEQLGLYTKIGNFVYGTIAITWHEQNSTGQVGISLPFTSANVAGTRTSGYAVYQDGFSMPSGQGSTHLIGYGGQNASSMYFYYTGGTNNSELGAGGTYLADNMTSSHNVIRIVFHYRTG